MAKQDIDVGQELLYDYGERREEVLHDHPWLLAGDNRDTTKRVALEKKRNESEAEDEFDSESDEDAESPTPEGFSVSPPSTGPPGDTEPLSGKDEENKTG